MIKPMNEITIIYACDNNFVPLLAASIKSVEVNSPGVHKHIYVVSDGISVNNLAKLRSSFSSPEISLQIVNVKSVVGKEEKIPALYHKALPKTTFIRLFAERIVPEGTKRVLYLDADMIVQSHLSDLWTTDLEGNIVGAVQDPGIKTLGCSWGGGVKNYKELGLKSEDLYFNSGLLLIDLVKWKQYGVMKKALEVSEKYRKYLVYADQYCLNVVLANKWYGLDKRWNHFVNNPGPSAFLLHYIGLKPIFSGYSYSETYRSIFFSYLNQTSWRGLKLLSKADQRFLVFKQFLKKIIQ